MMAEIGREKINCISALWTCLGRTIIKIRTIYHYIFFKTHSFQEEFRGKTICNRKLPCRIYCRELSLNKHLLRHFLFLCLIVFTHFFATDLFVRTQMLAVENGHEITSKQGHPKSNTFVHQIFSSS